MIWVVPSMEIERFNKYKTMGLQLQAAWENIINELSIELRKEVQGHGIDKFELKLIENKNDKYKAFRFFVEDASDQLEKILEDQENIILAN